MKTVPLLRLVLAAGVKIVTHCSLWPSDPIMFMGGGVGWSVAWGKRVLGWNINAILL